MQKIWSLSLLAAAIMTMCGSASNGQSERSTVSDIRGALVGAFVKSYSEAEVVLEKVVSDTNDERVTIATIARLADAARQMAGPNPTDSYKLSAVRKAIYDPGLWNYNRAFSYDLTDPLGQKPGNRLLSTYIRARKGNCVSMPILFLIVADRMGLNVHLASAPLHLFVRYTDPQGVDHNLETTSGGIA